MYRIIVFTLYICVCIYIYILSHKYVSTLLFQNSLCISPPDLGNKESKNIAFHSQQRSGKELMKTLF